MTAGAGINGVTVELKGEKFTRRLQTGVRQIRFHRALRRKLFGGLPCRTLPVGYALQDLAAQNITVESGSRQTLNHGEGVTRHQRSRRGL